MKTVLGIAGICALVGAAPLTLRADDTPAKEPPVQTLTSKTPAPAMQPAPAAIPMTAPVPPPQTSDFSTGDPEQQVTEQIAEARQEKSEAADLKAFDSDRQQQAYDNDWMLRDYTAALKKEGLAKSPQTDPSLLPHPDNPQATSTLDDDLLPHPAEKRRTPPPPTVEANDMSQLAPSKSLSPLALQPLMTPFVQPAGKPQRDPWAIETGPDGNAQAEVDLTPPPAFDRARNTLSSDTNGSLLDSPGLTAQQDGLTASADLNLQDASLPDQDPVRARPRVNTRDNFLVPTAPTSDVAEFFKKQADALNPPVAPTALPAVVAKPPIVDPFPHAKPLSTGLRSHIADPFDILNR